MNYCSWHFVSCYKLRSMSRLVSLSCPDDAMYMSRDWYMDTATTTLRICGTNGTIVFDCQCVSVGPDKLWHYWKSFWNMSTRNQYQGISQCHRRRGPTIQLWSFLASLQVPSDYHTTCVSHLLLSVAGIFQPMNLSIQSKAARGRSDITYSATQILIDLSSWSRSEMVLRLIRRHIQWILNVISALGFRFTMEWQGMEFRDSNQSISCAKWKITTRCSCNAFFLIHYYARQGNSLAIDNNLIIGIQLYPVEDSVAGDAFVMSIGLPFVSLAAEQFPIFIKMSFNMNMKPLKTYFFFNAKS